MPSGAPPPPLHFRSSPFVAVAAGLLAFVGCALVGSCGTSLPPAAEDETTSRPQGASCTPPTEGCACATTGETISCGSMVAEVDEWITCASGTRTCQANHAWGACNATLVEMKAVPVARGGRLSTLGLGANTTSCTSDPCDPYCSSYTDTPSGIVPGPGLSVTDSGLTLSGSDAPCNTSISGTVMDPGENVGLSGVYVYQPAGPVAPIADNVGGLTPPTCDSCATLTPPVVVSTITDVNGNFTLNGVPAGNVTIVAQTGRWRRVTTVSTTACSNTELTLDQIRMPANRMEGNIPKMAMVIGDREALECWLLKIGISSSEIQPFATPSDANRIQLFRTSGETTTSGLPPSGASLWGSCTGAAGCTAATSGALNEYSAILLPCDSQDVTAVGSQFTRMMSYANAGGRIFMDHLTGAEWLAPAAASPWSSNQVSTWQGNTTPAGVPAKGQVLNGTPAQMALYDWLGVWAPLPYGVGWVQSSAPRSDALIQGSDAVEWIRGESNNNWTSDPAGNYALSFSFSTPIGAGAGNYCGRAIYNGMHVSQTRASGAYPFTTASSFPSSCTLGFPLTPEEIALEYQFFQLTACLGTSPIPPPPPPNPAIFTRDFEAVCAAGTCPVWQAFEWQATFPAGTSIAFRAATADTEDALPPSPPAAAPVTVPIATATTTVLAPNWANDDNTVAWHLANAPPGPSQTSEAWLRVYMALNPNSYSSPTLSGWQQLYDCTPCQ